MSPLWEYCNIDLDTRNFLRMLLKFFAPTAASDVRKKYKIDAF